MIKTLISTVVFVGDSLAKRLRKFFGRSAPGTCVFLNYHSITAATQEGFARQMALLLRIATPLSEIKRQTLPTGAHHVVITFDDAFCSFADYALPILKAQKIPVVLFVPSGFLGRKSSWFDYGGENPVGEEVMSAEQLVKIVREGGVEIGSHSVLHRNLAEISDDESRAEMRESKAALEQLLGRKINSISFPYGSYSARELRLATEVGYGFCFGVMPQTVVAELREGLLGRVSVQPSDGPWEFQLKATGAYRWLPWAVAWKHRLLRRLSVSARTEKARAYG